MNVVTSAMITSTVNSRGEITSEIEPDIEDDQLHEAAPRKRSPSAAESRQASPAQRDAMTWRRSARGRGAAVGTGLNCHRHVRGSSLHGAAR
jgi:hypothetical protein